MTRTTSTPKAQRVKRRRPHGMYERQYQNSAQNWRSMQSSVKNDARSTIAAKSVKTMLPR